MEFKIMNPPIKTTQQRSYKRLLNLHLAVLILSVVTIITKAFIPVADGDFWSPYDMLKTLGMLLLGVFVSIFVEFLFAFYKHKTSEFFAYSRYVDPINTGLIVALLLPLSTPIFVLVIAVFVAVYFGKILFGRKGYYIFNPALVGVLFATILFSSSLSYVDMPIMLLQDLLNGTNIEFNAIRVLFGNFDEIAIGATSVITLIGLFFYLVITRVIDIKISGMFIISILLISLLVGYSTFRSNPLDYMIVNSLDGMIIFAAVFLVPETITSPGSRDLQLLYATIIAVIIMAVRSIGSTYEGVLVAVLIGNFFSKIGSCRITRTTGKSLLITLFFIAVLIVGVSLLISVFLNMKI